MASERHCASRGGVRGFTLLEILVVIVIIGIVVSMASLAIGVLGRDKQSEDEARRLWAVLTQAREESELQGRDVGLYLEKGAYIFMRFDPRLQSWVEITDDDFYARRELPEGLNFRLRLESRDVILKSAAEAERDAAPSADSIDKEEDAADTAERREEKKDKRVPQVAVLSSGDLSPFDVQVERESSDVHWHVKGQPDNTLVVESGDAKS